MTRRSKTEPAPSTLAQSSCRTAIIAGSGLLPKLLAEKIFAAGGAPFLVGLKGEVGGWIGEYEHMSAGIVELSLVIKAMKAASVGRVVLAGGMRARPDFWSIPRDFVTLSSLPAAYRALRKGDDALLRFFVSFINRHGFEVIGAQTILPDLLAARGLMTRMAPKGPDKRDLEAALHAAREIGRLDIGQGAVAVSGRVVAVEGAEGTDGMLARIVDLRKTGRLSARSRGTLVKVAKPGQELRADLPSIGPATVENAAAAGLAGIAVGADCSLVIDFQKTVDRADELGLFIVGFDAEGWS